MAVDSETLLRNVLYCSIGGAGVFMVTFVQVVCKRHLRDPSEIPYLRELIQCLRVVIGLFLMLLLPLFWIAATELHPVFTPITSYGSEDSWNFGWGRPCMHFMLAFIGLFLDYHPTARFCYIAGMLQALAFDTLSSYDLGTMIDCLESGRCALPEGCTLSGLKFLNARDLASVLLASWGLLLIGILTLVIGTCRIKYGFRRLHAGDHNRIGKMRAELAKHGTREPPLDTISMHSNDSLV